MMTFGGVAHSWITRLPLLSQPIAEHQASLAIIQGLTHNLCEGDGQWFSHSKAKLQSIWINSEQVGFFSIYLLLVQFVIWCHYEAIGWDTSNTYKTSLQKKFEKRIGHPFHPSPCHHNIVVNIRLRKEFHVTSRDISAHDKFGYVGYKTPKCMAIW